jgi:catechol 2,3-dioxygenase-like lactoylglutathione lyase family enzyme
MIDHVMLKVKNYDALKKFYEQALAPLGYKVMKDYPGAACGFGETMPDFWLAKSTETAPTHFAISASNRKAVDAFYAAALKAGATDNGKPGVRKDYHPDYYGAFVRDPEGNNLEAVCHKPE